MAVIVFFTAQPAKPKKGQTYTFDAVQNPTSVTDSLSRVTRLEWCTCGALTRLIDPLGRITTWEQDLQSRTVAKTYADGSQERFSYDPSTDRLAAVVDAQGQFTTLTYLSDDSLAGVYYQQSQQSTPAVTFSYDPAYPRPVSMTDGTGVTTFTYRSVTGGFAPGANQVWEEIKTGLINSRVTYSYDALSRVTSRAVDGVAQTYSRDATGRLSAINNALGVFGYNYQNASSRLIGATLPNGQNVAATFLGDAQNRRLQQLKNSTADGSVISQFDYGYNAGGRLLAWKQAASGGATVNYSVSYDAADQLTAAIAPGRDHTFGYDTAGNLRTRGLNGTTRNFAYNILNEIQTATPALGGDKTYAWDGANRLVGINYTGTNASTRLTHDGLGRCVEIAEMDGGTPVSVKRYVWCGSERVEERDASGAVRRRFFSQGEQASGVSFFYTFDHLGSVREMTDATGAVRARYDYDPYGLRTKIAGDLEASLGFTGHLFHGPSGLHFTRFRAYDAATGHWLSRDPLGEDAGLNLYAYVSNDPVNYSDPLGLIDYNAASNAAAGVVGNSLGLAGAFALTGATGGAAAVVVGGIGLKSAYGLSVSLQNLAAATFADDGSGGVSKGALLNDVGELVAPGNSELQGG